MAPRSVNELMNLNTVAAVNLLDMMDEGSLDANDGARIAELYAAHSTDEQTRCALTGAKVSA
jgi:hypothetical protein